MQVVRLRKRKSRAAWSFLISFPCPISGQARLVANRQRPPATSSSRRGSHLIGPRETTHRAISSVIAPFPLGTWGDALQRLPIRLWMASFRGSPSSLQWERVPVTVSRPLLSFLIPSRRAITHEAIPHLHGLAGTSALVWSRPDECLGSGCGFGSPGDQMP